MFILFNLSRDDSLAPEQPDQLANPEHERRGADDDAPILPGQRRDVEHLASERDDQVLADQDDRRHEQEAFALAQPGEGGGTLHEGLRVEHVPELQHHEEAEEPRQVVCGEAASGVEVE